jgi:adenosine deaminase
MADSTDVRRLIEGLPKGELHVHLRGAIPARVLTELLSKHGAERALAGAADRVKAMWAGWANIRPFLTPRHWSEAEVSHLFRYESLDNFLYTYYFTGFFVRDRSDFALLVLGVLDDLAARGVVYAEITVSAIEYAQQGLALPEVAACLAEGMERPDIRVQWIIDLVRDLGPDVARRQVEAIAALRSPGIVGITLGGSEQRWPPGQFADVYALARDRGLRLSVHAGEALGPESVLDAVEKLRAERIGHGVRAAEEPSVMRRLADGGIALEICPTSNIRTGAYRSYDEHPAKALFDAGIPVTVNTDDPTFFGTTLAEEYAHLHGMGFGFDDLLQVLRNGFRYSFLPADEASAYVTQLERAWAEAVEGG